jgi:PEP-CTERM motif-containing protein
MKLKLALAALTALFFTGMAQADGSSGDDIINIQTENVSFYDGSTLNITMQVDLTESSVLDYSAEFIDPEQQGITLGLVTYPGGEYGSSYLTPTYASFVFEGDGLIMNFGNFDYSDAFYYPLAFPQPGTYGPLLMYVDICPAIDPQGVCDGNNFPVSGEVIVTTVTNAPEPSTYAMLIGGIVALFALFRIRGVPWKECVAD